MPRGSSGARVLKVVRRRRRFRPRAVEAKGITAQAMLVVPAVQLRDRRGVSLSLHQRHGSKSGPHYGGARPGGRALSARHLLGVGPPVAADLPLKHGVSPHAHDRQQRQGGKPCRLLAPHGAEGGWIRAPPAARGHSGLWLRIGRQHRRIRTPLSPQRGGQDSPARLLRRAVEGRHLDHAAIAGRWRRRLRGGRAPAAGAAPAPRLRGDALTHRMILPRPGPAATPALPMPCIGGDGRVCIGGAGKPVGCHPPARRCAPLGFWGLGEGRGVSLRRRHLPRGPHDNTPRRLDPPPITLRHVSRADEASPRPLARRLLPGPSRLLPPERPCGLRRSPGCPCLPHRPGARSQGHKAAPAFQAPPQRPSTIRLTVGHKAAPPLAPQRETRVDRPRGLHASTQVALPTADAPGESALATPPQAQEPLVASSPTIVAMPRRGPRWQRPPPAVGRQRVCTLGLIGPIEGERRGSRREPRRGDGIDLQRCEGHGAKHLLHVGRQPRIEDLPHARLVARRASPVSLEQGQPPTRLPTGTDLLARMVSGQHRPDKRCHPTPT
jgi:hypothetical protein